MLSSPPTTDYRHYAVQAAIDHYWMMNEHQPQEIITRTLLEMMHRGAQGVFAEVYRIGKPVVLDWHIEEWIDQFDGKTRYRLHYRLIVCEFQKMFLPEIPSLSFVAHTGITMWKCRYCQMINTDEATYCGEQHDRAVGCGAPRELKQ